MRYQIIFISGQKHNSEHDGTNPGIKKHKLIKPAFHTAKHQQFVRKKQYSGKVHRYYDQSDESIDIQTGSPIKIKTDNRMEDKV
jgi:hypothetical protein